MSTKRKLSSKSGTTDETNKKQRKENPPQVPRPQPGPSDANKELAMALLDMTPRLLAQRPAGLYLIFAPTEATGDSLIKYSATEAPSFGHMCVPVYPNCLSYNQFTRHHSARLTAEFLQDVQNQHPQVDTIAALIIVIYQSKLDPAYDTVDDKDSLAYPLQAWQALLDFIHHWPNLTRLALYVYAHRPVPVDRDWGWETPLQNVLSQAASLTHLTLDLVFWSWKTVNKNIEISLPTGDDWHRRLEEFRFYGENIKLQRESFRLVLTLLEQNEGQPARTIALYLPQTDKKLGPQQHLNLDNHPYNLIVPHLRQFGGATMTELTTNLAGFAGLRSLTLRIKDNTNLSPLNGLAALTELRLVMDTINGWIAPGAVLEFDEATPNLPRIHALTIYILKQPRQIPTRIRLDFIRDRFPNVQIILLKLIAINNCRSCRGGKNPDILFQAQDGEIVSRYCFLHTVEQWQPPWPQQLRLFRAMYTEEPHKVVTFYPVIQVQVMAAPVEPANPQPPQQPQ